MKILYVVTQGHGGGAQKYVLQLARNFDSYVAAGTDAEDLFRQAQILGVKTIRLKHLKRNINIFRDCFAVAELYSLIRQLKPDIVHLNSSKAGFVGSFAGRLAGAKVIFTAHGFRYNEPGSATKKQIFIDLEKLASWCRNYIIAVSEADEKSALDNKIIAPEKISTIHNGIGAISFLSRDDSRRNLNLPDDKFIFGTVAGAYKTKGLDVLIDAVSKLDKNILEKLLFAIIGDGPELLPLTSYLLPLKLENSVRFLGRIDRADELLKAFDAFILPSRKEGFPYTLLEAMQAGLPIIATDVGGNKEAVGDAAAIIPSEDPAALALGLTDIFSNPDKRQNLSQKAAERSKVFTEQKMLEETKIVYEKILAK